MAKIDLHVHPYFESYGLEDIAKAMHKKRLNVMGLINYNTDNFDEARKNADNLKNYSRNLKIKADSQDNLLIRINIESHFVTGPVYLLRGIEVLNDDFHLLVIGNNRDVKPEKGIEENIEKGLENDALVILDHPFADALSPRKGIDKKKRQKLIELCSKYPVALEWNSYCIPWVRKAMLGNNANYEVEKFGEELQKLGKKISVVADSDIHARNKRLLKGIGESYIEVKGIDFSSGTAMIKSLKKQIVNGEGISYRNNKEYASFWHFLEAFGLPMIFNMSKKRG